MIEIIILVEVLGIVLALYITLYKNPESSKRYDDIVKKILNEKDQGVEEAQTDEANRT